MQDSGVPKCLLNRGSNIINKLDNELKQKAHSFDVPHYNPTPLNKITNHSFSDAKPIDYGLADKLLFFDKSFNFDKVDSSFSLQDRVIPKQDNFPVSKGIDGLSDFFNERAIDVDFRYTDPQYYEYRLQNQSLSSMAMNKWRADNTEDESDLHPTSKMIGVKSKAFNFADDYMKSNREVKRTLDNMIDEVVDRNEPEEPITIARAQRRSSKVPILDLTNVNDGAKGGKKSGRKLLLDPRISKRPHRNTKPDIIQQTVGLSFKPPSNGKPLTTKPIHKIGSSIKPPSHRKPLTPKPKTETPKAKTETPTTTQSPKSPWRKAQPVRHSSPTPHYASPLNRASFAAAGGGSSSSSTKKDLEALKVGIQTKHVGIRRARSKPATSKAQKMISSPMLETPIKASEFSTPSTSHKGSSLEEQKSSIETTKIIYSDILESNEKLGKEVAKEIRKETGVNVQAKTTGRKALEKLEAKEENIIELTKNPIGKRASQRAVGLRQRKKITTGDQVDKENINLDFDFKEADERAPSMPSTLKKTTRGNKAFTKSR